MFYRNLLTQGRKDVGRLGIVEREASAGHILGERGSGTRRLVFVGASYDAAACGRKLFLVLFAPRASLRSLSQPVKVGGM
jgi:hypothetical protein